MSVVEVATFRLRDGVDEADFLDADRRVQTDFIPTLPGFMRRTTARGRDGEWLVVVLWGSFADAEAADALAADDEGVRTFMSAIDDATYRRERYETLD